MASSFAQAALAAVTDSFEGYTLIGGDGSPYSCKLRALLRYRRIPFRWVAQAQLGNMGDHWQLFPDLKAKVIPILVRPDGSYAIDSTPLILELEAAVPNCRTVVPPAPADAFIAALLEDFADEWVTKIMFEGRFHTKADGVFGASWQIWQVPPAGVAIGGTKPESVDGLAEGFATRQIGRRSLVVGSSGWVEMERCLRDICKILTDMYRAGQPFLLGQRPSNADFALFGQLRELAADPLPSRIMHEYPCAWSWVWRMDELGGFEPPAWPEAAQGFAADNAAARALLTLAGETYVPFMRANAAAVAAGEKEVTVGLRGGRVQHHQSSFRYQAVYCVPQLRAQFQALAHHPHERARALLQETGCLALVQDSATGSSAMSRL